MEEFIDKDIEQLEALAAVREDEIVEYVLEACIADVEDRKSVIDSLFESSLKKSDAERGVMEFITKYIATLMQGRLTVTTYVEKNKSKQEVFVYVHTHWKVIELTLYYVFVKRVAAKLGLSEIYYEDTDFMNKVYERLAFRVMEYRKTKVPHNEVWVNFQNGTLVLKADGTRCLRPHDPEDFFLYALSYPYAPQAECPLWHKFLDRVLPEVDMQNLLGEYIGYCFTKNLKLERQLVMAGSGANGKSVCMDIITALLGKSNVSNVSLTSLTMDDEKRAQIEFKLCNISHESNSQLDYAILKQLVSAEPTECRVLYRGTHTMYDIPKLITSYNILPNPETSHGFMRRMILLPFNVTIPEEEQDIDLTAKLMGELPGILNWVLGLLAGLLERKAFSKSKSSESALKDYINSSNSALYYINSHCEMTDTDGTKLADLYRSYTTFCTGEELSRFGKKNFKLILKSIGVKEYISHNTIYLRVKIKDNDII